MITMSSPPPAGDVVHSALEGVANEDTMPMHKYDKALLQKLIFSPKKTREVTFSYARSVRLSDRKLRAPDQATAVKDEHFPRYL